MGNYKKNAFLVFIILAILSINLSFATPSDSTDQEVTNISNKKEVLLNRVSSEKILLNNGNNALDSEFSTLNSMEAKIESSDDWIEFEEKFNVPLSKDWTIEFSGEVRKDKVEAIVIEKGDEFIPVTIKILEDNKILVTPVVGYEPSSQYCIKIFLNNGNKYKMYFNTTSQTITIRLSADDNSIIGDGFTNTKIRVEFLDSLSGVRIPINGIQVKLVTTHGTLSDSIITLQNGYGHTTLNSDTVVRETMISIDAKIVENSVPIGAEDYIKELSDTLNLIFTTPPLEDFPILLLAESNQADRVTLYFDREVSVNEISELIGNMNNVIITQPVIEGSRIVLGVHRLPGSDFNSVDVILSKDDVLTDNKRVDVYLLLSRDGDMVTTPIVNFILTDNRIPEVTHVIYEENMRQLKIYFSEAIDSAKFTLDEGTNPINLITYGEYNNFMKTDERHIVTLDAEYLLPGIHSIQISEPQDFAARTDPNNIGTTQIFEFVVLANDNLLTAAIVVESPEQYRIFLDNADRISQGYNLQDIRLEMLDKNELNPYLSWKEVKLDIGPTHPSQYPNSTNGAEDWKGKLDFNGTKDLVWVSQYDDFKELVVETNTDWTWVFDTINSGDNYYNHEFRIVIPSGMFINSANNYSNQEILIPVDLFLDKMSPVLMGAPMARNVDLGQFQILYNEPIKGINIEEIQVRETPPQLSELITSLPNIVVEYIGKNANGDTVTKYGAVTGYALNRGTNTEIVVECNENLRDLVDYYQFQEEWLLIVRNVTDDIGNSAVTITYPFLIPARPW